MHLTSQDEALLDGRDGEGVAMAMRILVDTARVLDAQSLIPIASAHIDGCLYHGDDDP
jgi:predicted aconitase